MINQLTGMVPLAGSERMQRSQASGEAADSEKNSASGKQDGVDTTSLSPAAMAMARNVPPAGASAEQGKLDTDKSERMAEKSLEKRIDIRV
ncbi:MAG: hypothetical protein FD168_1947 [Desulfobulbaceae bacterium]|jgi:hypothetical protein|nr:MAG: hypothetical protein FD168_1947 [Desulfobulbaceae bacterium]